MWELKNNTPFAASGIIAIDKLGARAWVIVVKATFSIASDGKLTIADEQLAPEAAAKYRGQAGESSLIYEQDLVGEKPRTDLYLNASAHAPRGRATTELTVAMRSPAGVKTLTVRGDRRWQRNAMGVIQQAAAEPFVKMPIVYERAFGGYDRTDASAAQHRLEPRNPVGTGFFAASAHRAGKLAPNIALAAGPESAVAGFGALCSYWEPRIAYQGSYDANWVKQQKPLLPLDYDSQFLQCAPRDQQFSPPLRGGEPIELSNLTAGGSLRLELPKHYFAFTTHAGRRELEHRARLNTVVIDPDDDRLIMVWAGALSCHQQIDAIDYTRVIEKAYV
jgi:hypothetical protein